MTTAAKGLAAVVVLLEVVWLRHPVCAAPEGHGARYRMLA
jgi:hypothetical protein